MTLDERIGKIVENASIALGETVAFLKIQNTMLGVMKRGFDMTLRYVGQRFAGDASRTLMNLAVRSSVSRIVGQTMAHLTTRLMLALSTTATGVGAILGVVELISLAMDLALAFGWDPGNYRNEFDNEVYDDMARAWKERKMYAEATAFEPDMLLAIITASERRTDKIDGSLRVGDLDDSNPPAVRDESDAPWFFVGFAEAVKALVDDSKTTTNDTRNCRDATTRQFDDSNVNTALRLNHREDNDSDVTRRSRPFATNDTFVSALIWDMHYFRHRRYNSLGQRVENVDAETISIDDDFVTANITANNHAAVNSRSRIGDRARLLGSARRNLTDKIIGRLMLATNVTAVGIVTALVAILARFYPSLALMLSLVFVLCLVAAHIVAEIARNDVIANKYPFDDNPTGDKADEIDRLCELVVDTVRQLSRTASSSTSKRIALNALFGNVTRELRVLFATEENNNER